MVRLPLREKHISLSQGPFTALEDGNDTKDSIHEGPECGGLHKAGYSMYWYLFKVLYSS